MLVLDQENLYNFSNMTVKVTDNTVQTDGTITRSTVVPRFNMLVPIVTDVGITNTLELFHSGEQAIYLNAHGTPNPLKYGFGPDIIHAILSSGADCGVYTINLRGSSATMANSIVLMKYKVEKDVPYTDASGAQYYYTKNGQITTDPTTEGEANTPIIRDVLHAKYTGAYSSSVKKWADLHTYMDTLVSKTPDEEGYCTIPLFAVMYRGASAFGNNCYMSLHPHMAEFDGNYYYSATVFDGVNTKSSSATMSMDLDSGSKYNANNFIENQFNETFGNMRMLAYNGIEDLYDIVNPYMFTVDEFIAGTYKTPARTLTNCDIFNANEFAFVTDPGSMNMQVANAITLTGGVTGTETPDQLYEAFFKGEILEDIESVLRYRINYIPDVNYNDATKQAIINLVTKRNHMTTATLMVGGLDTFESAIIDHQAHYYETMPNIRQLAKVQSPMRYNEFIRRTIMYPASYHDVLAMCAHLVKWGNPYQPFAGANARWTGFIEDTMKYPSMSVDVVNALQKNRINVVMKDAEDGAYLSEQQMNTVLTSDQTEFNNALLISDMLYDLLDLVHRNHYKFNEAEEVRIFTEAVNDCINTKFAPYSASLQVEVWRAGTVGREKSKNYIRVTVDLKDINKFTDVEIVLTEE